MSNLAGIILITRAMSEVSRAWESAWWPRAQSALQNLISYDLFPDITSLANDILNPTPNPEPMAKRVRVFLKAGAEAVHLLAGRIEDK